MSKPRTEVVVSELPEQEKKLLQPANRPSDVAAKSSTSTAAKKKAPQPKNQKTLASFFKKP